MTAPGKLRTAGLAGARMQRERALAAYDADPNHCEKCSSVIPVPDGVMVKNIRRLRFCCKSCATSFNNVIAPKKIKKPPICQRCLVNTVQTRPSGSYNLLCEPCWTKEQARSGLRLRSELTHPAIRSHARYVLKRHKPEMKCDWCSYDKHVECCHLKPIAEFAPEATASEMNAEDNLRWLCPNCHWELDHGLRGNRI
jgi:hypothetical protein